MRDLQSGHVDYLIGIKDQVEVEGARSPMFTGSPSGPAFEVLQEIEQDQRFEVRLNFRGRVGEFSSGVWSHGLGSKYGTDTRHGHGSVPPQARDSPAERLVNVTDVAAEGEIAARHATAACALGAAPG